MELTEKKGKKNLDRNFWLYAFGEFVLVFLEDLNMTIFIYNLSIRTYRRALVSTEILIADIEKELS